LGESTGVFLYNKNALKVIQSRVRLAKERLQLKMPSSKVKQSLIKGDRLHMLFNLL
jgi:hypothetical protein